MLYTSYPSLLTETYESGFINNLIFDLASNIYHIYTIYTVSQQSGAMTLETTRTQGVACIKNILPPSSRNKYYQVLKDSTMTVNAAVGHHMRSDETAQFMSDCLKHIIVLEVIES
jgi:hypothetical protein